MTGREFVSRLEAQISERDLLDKPYSAADLTQDAATAGLWYRKPVLQELEQEEALQAARSEVAPRPAKEAQGE